MTNRQVLWATLSAAAIVLVAELTVRPELSEAAVLAGPMPPIDTVLITATMGTTGMPAFEDSHRRHMGVLDRLD